MRFQMLTAVVVTQESLLVQEVDTEAFWFGPAVLNICRYFKNQKDWGLYCAPSFNHSFGFDLVWFCTHSVAKDDTEPT